MANLNLISPPTYSDGEVEAALLREIRTGFKLERALEEQRHRDARELAHDLRKGNRTVPGLGKAVAVVPGREFFRLREKYGEEEIHSKEFQRSLRKLEPDLCINRV